MNVGSQVILPVSVVCVLGQEEDVVAVLSIAGAQAMVEGEVLELNSYLPILLVYIVCHLRGLKVKEQIHYLVLFEII